MKKEEPKKAKKAKVELKTERKIENKSEAKVEPKKQESVSKPSGSTSTSKPSSNQPKCQTETITIPEKGHNERYLISDEVWEDRPVYKRVEYYITNQTGAVVPDGVDPYDFIEKNNLPDISYRTAVKTVQVRTERVKVKDAVYGERWVVDTPARTEKKCVCD